MCGPEGTGLFYARARSLPELEQTFVGPFGMRMHTLDYLGGTFETAEGAGRFDVGSSNLGLLVGQQTSMQWIGIDLGLDWVTTRITACACRMRSLIGSLTSPKWPIPKIAVHTIAIETMKPPAAAKTIGVSLDLFADPAQRWRLFQACSFLFAT